MADIQLPDMGAMMADVNRRLGTLEALPAGLTQELADTLYLGKLDKAESAKVADSATAVAWSGVTDKPNIPSIDGLVPKTGARGALAGYESIGQTPATVNHTSPDVSVDTSNAAFTVGVGVAGVSAVKLVFLLSDSVAITLASGAKWAGGKAPTLKASGVLVVAINGTTSVVSYVAGA